MISPNSYSLFYFIFFIAASTAFQIYHRRNPSSICGKRQTFKMMFGNIASKMSDLIEVISGQQTITESNIEASLKEIKGILIDADVNVQVTNSLIEKVKQKAIGMKVESRQSPGEQFISLLASEMIDTMGKAQVPLIRRTDGRPTVIVLSGLQGAGKTTAAGKLCNWALRQQFAKKPLLVAADIYRPAAIDQLETLGARLNVDVYSERDNNNPVQICRKALTKATSEGYDMVVFDTAGRQVVDERLMDELKQVKAAVKPDEVLLVVDAMTGQEAATLTAKFNDDIGITGAILTKMDGDTRGGSALSVRGVSGKPIKFVGVGEGMDDLEPFFPDRMASRILGMGDIQTFLEKAQAAVDTDLAAKSTRRMQIGTFTFNDYLNQMNAVRKMGGMSSMLNLIPGASKIDDKKLFEAEQRTRVAEKIIGAMTEEERENPDLVCAQGGRKDLVLGALERRKMIAERAELGLEIIDGFIFEFMNMKKIMAAQLKGIDLDRLEKDPNAPIMTSKEQAINEKKQKKMKSTRGGGGGFGKAVK